MRRRRSYDDSVPALRDSVASLEDPDDDDALSRAITAALGVHAEVADEGPGLVGLSDERILDLADTGRPGRRVRLRFPNPYEVPPTALLEQLVSVVADRLEVLRRNEEHRLGRQRAKRRGA